jgi:hypothetical protein
LDLKTSFFRKATVSPSRRRRRPHFHSIGVVLVDVLQYLSVECIAHLCRIQPLLHLPGIVHHLHVHAVVHQDYVQVLILFGEIDHDGELDQGYMAFVVLVFGLEELDEAVICSSPGIPWDLSPDFLRRKLVMEKVLVVWE